MARAKRYTIQLTRAQILDVATCLEHSADHGHGLGQESLGSIGPLLFDAAYRRRYALINQLMSTVEGK